MPVITFDYKDFIDLLGYHISKEELINKLPMIGADFDKLEENEISIEFFPNRPDLSSVEGIARASRAFFGFETGLRKYDVKKSSISVDVDYSVKSIRPFVATALVKNLVMTDRLIASLMDLQEKLHFGLGRNRKKVAIGVHDFEPIQPPFKYKAVDPDSVEFVPLAKTESMTLREILERHEKGVEYAHLLKKADKYPLIVDANNNVLSFPPIINGSLTEVTPYTKNVFIDVTGTDRRSIEYALNIIITALAERGGDIYNTIVRYDRESYVFPDLTPKKKILSTTYVNKILGMQMREKEIIDSLRKMGYNATVRKNKKQIMVEIPPWRSDILHEIDLVEDVAIGYGFERFKTDFPRESTFGKTLPHHDIHENLRRIMIGLGFNEITTFTISNKRDEFTKMRLKTLPHVQIKNPIGEEYSCLRTGLIPSLLKILSENRHHPLPQQIFELGIVVDEKAKNHYSLAAVKIDAKANFSECKSLVEALLRDIGVKKSCDIREKKHPAFIIGRCAAIIKNGREIGFFGEIHPETITAFNLSHPIIAFEIRTNHIIKTLH